MSINKPDFEKGNPYLESGINIGNEKIIPKDYANEMQEKGIKVTGGADAMLKSITSALPKEFMESQDLGLMGVDSKNQQKFATFLTINKIDLNEWNNMKPEEQKKYLDGFAKTGEGQGKTEGKGGTTEQKKENKILHSSLVGMEKYNTLYPGYYSQAQIDAMKTKEQIKGADRMQKMANDLKGGKKTEQQKVIDSSGASTKIETGNYEISKDQIKAADQLQKEADKLEKGKTNGTEKKTNVTPKTVEQRVGEVGGILEKKGVKLSDDEKKKLLSLDKGRMNKLQADLSYYIEKKGGASKNDIDDYKKHLMKENGLEVSGNDGEKIKLNDEEQKLKEDDGSQKIDGGKNGADKGSVDRFQGYKQEDITNYRKVDNGYEITTTDNQVHFVTEKEAMDYNNGLDGKQRAELQKKIKNNNTENGSKDSNSNVGIG